MIDFTDSKVWNKRKLHTTIQWIKKNLIIKQENRFALVFWYCHTNKKPMYYNIIRCIDKYGELPDTTFTSFKNLVSYYYQWLITSDNKTEIK